MQFFLHIPIKKENKYAFYSNKFTYFSPGERLSFS